MGKTRKAGAVNAIISYIGVVLGYVNVAILFPKFFEPDQMGLRAVLMEFSTLLSQFTLLGFTGLTNKYFPYFRTDANQQKNFLWFIIGGPLAGFIFFSGLLFLFRQQLFLSYKDTSPLIYEYYILIFPITFSMAYSTLLEIYSAFFNPAVGTFLREILLRILTTIFIVLYITKLIDIHTFWYLFTGSYVLALLLLVFYLFRIGEFKLKFSWMPIEKEMLKPMFLFSIFGFFIGAATSLIIKIDTVMIVYIMKNLTAMGIYSLALYISALIEIPKRALVQVTNPLLSKAFKENDLETVESLYKKTCLNQLIAGSFIFLMIWLNIDSIFTIIPRREIFGQGMYVVLFLGLAKLLDLTTGNNGEIINYSPYYKFGFVIVAILIGVIVTLNLILIPSYGIEGAAIATLISFFIFNLLKYLFILKKYRMQPFSGKNVGVVVLGLATFLVVKFLPKPDQAFVSIIITSIYTFVLFCIPVVLFRISPEINHLIDHFLMRKK